MSYRHWMQTNRVWAPRTLAVLSCAIALLAAQPVLLKAETRPVPLPVSAPVPSVADSALTTRARPVSSVSSTTRRETAFFTSARRLHILATVEILKRLLTAELQPQYERVLLPALLSEPVNCIELVAAPLTLPGSNGAPDYPSLPPPERQFVREHTQLAPPMV